MWLALIGLAAAVRPMYVHTYEGELGFVVRDHQGDNIGAWHFAHHVRDQEIVNKLKPVIYGRRFGAILAGGGGLVCFGGGLGYLFTEGRPGSPDGIVVRPDAVVAGSIAAGGFLLIASSVAIIRFKPKKLRVDSHYSLEEAANRIRATGIVILPSGLGIDATY